MKNTRKFSFHSNRNKDRKFFISEFVDAVVVVVAVAVAAASLHSTSLETRVEFARSAARCVRVCAPRTEMYLRLLSLVVLYSAARTQSTRPPLIVFHTKQSIQTLAAF